MRIAILTALAALILAAPANAKDCFGGPGIDPMHFACSRDFHATAEHRTFIWLYPEDARYGAFAFDAGNVSGTIRRGWVRGLANLRIRFLPRRGAGLTIRYWSVGEPTTFTMRWEAAR